MPHYVAVVEDAGPDTAVGIWFADLPGCFSGGDDLDEALRNAPEAIVLYADVLGEDGCALPPARTLIDLKRDPEIARDIDAFMVALVPAPATADAV
ncbi:MAG: type II toxin-antitoxin system HicB family antitoxin [Rhodoplanes sp.]|uniref:type II toxin-antitoxin system HicB family antitoxin n=1 Tax=Rhodoplanes sp. TaxID=1968906 RepID=UPI00179C958C|nr:type II toxin-antitoxin system HicB family antitoxin [Rhodoplanes sp.]NVO12647.1 type II toxin-antitoxin system HicB family antitoxin [Rhodoplanes sp.]